MVYVVMSRSEGLGCSKAVSIPSQLAEELLGECYVACIRIGKGSSGDFVLDVQNSPHSNPRKRVPLGQSCRFPIPAG